MSKTRPRAFDSGRAQVGVLYAKALLAAATSAGTAEATVSELEAFVHEVVEKLPDLEATLGSLRIPPEHKLKILEHALKGRMSPLLLNTFKVMAEHGRLDSLREMAKAARKQLNESQGRTEATLRTAAPVSDAMQQQVKARLKKMLGKEIDLKTEIRPEILGGIVVRVGDTLYDGSVAHRLAMMKVEALNDTIAALRAAPDRFSQV